MNGERSGTSMSDNSTETDGELKPLMETELTREQAKKWEDTMSMMVWTAPGFQHLLYKLLNAQGAGKPHAAVMSRQVSIAATDAKHIIVNPDTFFEMELRERVYVLGHEIIHNVFGDVELLHRCQTTGKVPSLDGLTMREFHNPTMQRAMDVRI